MNFDQYTLEAQDFIKQVAIELGNPEDPDYAVRVTRAVMHALREVFTPEESLEFIDFLPMYLKAVYVDGWRFRQEDRIRTMDEFIERLRFYDEPASFNDFGSDEAAKLKTRAVLSILQLQDGSQIGRLTGSFPRDLLLLWQPLESEHAG